MLPSGKWIPSFKSVTKNLQFGGSSAGWMGERSIPRTWALGYCSATSMAQTPGPVPTSRIAVGFGSMGAMMFPPTRERQAKCKSLRRWTSSSSLGRTYETFLEPWYPCKFSQWGLIPSTSSRLKLIGGPGMRVASVTGIKCDIRLIIRTQLQWKNFSHDRDQVRKLTVKQVRVKSEAISDHRTLGWWVPDAKP